MKLKQNAIHRLGNTLGLAGIIFILAIAFYIEFSQHHLPCPLCLLQRVCFTAVGVMMLANLFIEVRAAHYGLMIMASLLGLGVAVRQVLLHILPGDPGFDLPFLGLHLYTWCAITFLIMLVFLSLSLLFDRGFGKLEKSYLSYVCAFLFLGLVFCNTLVTFLECGLSVCPENPVHYRLLSVRDFAGYPLDARLG